MIYASSAADANFKVHPYAIIDIEKGRLFAFKFFHCDKHGGAKELDSCEDDI